MLQENSQNKRGQLSSYLQEIKRYTSYFSICLYVSSIPRLTPTL